MLNPTLFDKAIKLFIQEVNERDPVKQEMLVRRIGMIMRGHIGEGETLSNHIRYNHQRKDPSHIFSAKAFGYAFGYREYEKFLTFKDYLDMPIDMIEDLLEGYSRGTEELMIEKKREAEKQIAKEERR